jgi:hypothetical protein
MTATINFADFSVFADMYNDTVEKWNIQNDTPTDIQDYDDALKDYYDAYCSYLVSRKYDTETIKVYRKNAIIDFYITENKIADSLRKELDEYYIKNIKDTFNKKLNPPPCFFHQARASRKCEEAREKREIDTDDVAQHYINLKNMYKNVYEEMMNPRQHSHQHQHQHQHHKHHNDPLHPDYEDTESNYDKYIDYYEEYYNIYGSDNYTDREYNSDECSDEFDLNES